MIRQASAMKVNNPSDKSNSKLNVNNRVKFAEAPLIIDEIEDRPSMTRQSSTHSKLFGEVVEEEDEDDDQHAQTTRKQKKNKNKTSRKKEK